MRDSSKTVLFIAMLLLIAGKLPSTYAAGNTITTSTDSSATFNSASGGKCFVAVSLFWCFFSTGSKAAFATSTDGSTWSSVTNLFALIGGGWQFSIFYNGTVVAYARAYGGSALFFRMGTPQTGGTISWTAAEQTVNSTFQNGYPMITIDSNGYPWIGFTGDMTAGSNLPYITKASTRDGTWTTDASAPFSVNAIKLSNITSTVGWGVRPTALTGGKAYVIYEQSATANAKGRLITPGQALPAEETVTSRAPSDLDFYSTVAVGDNLYQIMRASGGAIIENNRPSGGSWSADVSVQTGTTSTAPTLALNTTDDTLVGIWAVNPISTNVYYKRCTGSFPCTWDSSPTVLQSEAADGNPNGPNAYQTTGSIGNTNYIIVEYTTKSVSPFNIKFASLSWVTPSPPRNLMATGGIRNSTLIWQPPTTGGRAPITGYRIYRGVSSGGESTTPLAQIGNLTSYLDASITGGVTYFYKVSAVTSLGESGLSNEASATPTSPPQPPTNLQLASGFLKYTLTWNPPTSNGGSPITHYRVYRGSSSGGETVFTTVGNQTSYTDYSVAYGKTYYYKLTALNILGESAFSNEASSSAAVSALPLLPFSLLLLTLLVLRTVMRRIPSKRKIASYETD